MWSEVLAAYAESSVTVKADPEQAFRRFTSELAAWWPLASHSVGQSEAETVVMEGRVGARTRVDLEHKGFERLGRMARRARRGYPIGWAYVLGLYARRRGPFMMLVSGLTAVVMLVLRMRERSGAPTPAK